jgi:hypothetical protein
MLKEDYTMKAQVELLGLINLILGAFGALTGLCVMALFFGLAPITRDAVGAMVLLIIGSIGGVWMLAFAIPSIIAGIGLLQHKSWARILTLILATLALFSFPIGTIIAIYTFWVLLQPEAEQLLSAA